MENDQNQTSHAFQQIQMRANRQHQYPHSHHGTPAMEYSGFSWPSPNNAESHAVFDHASPQRLNHQQLHPLVMPQWPSMLSSQSSQGTPGYYPSLAPEAQVSAVPPTPVMTPVSASSTRSASAPRRALTDDERRKMCEFHEHNPKAKQTEIGLRFGVERSTVSKVLRRKDRYLQKQNEVVRSPERRVKAKSPDIEKTLSNWVIKEQRKGVILSDSLIKEKAQYFASVSGPDNAGPNPADDPTWLQSFKRQHNISSNKVLNDSDPTSPVKRGPRNLSYEESSPMSPRDETSPSPNMLRGVHSNESFKIDSPEGYDLTTTLSANSIPATFTEASTSSMSPNSLLAPASPFFTPESTSVTMASFFPNPETTGDPAAPMSSFQRPRSQTFPMIFQNLHTDDGQSNEPTFMPSNILDAPMDDASYALVDSIDEPMAESPSADMGIDTTRPHPSATQTMQPPPLPVSAMAARAGNLRAGYAAVYETASRDPRQEIPPSQEEARRALNVVWEYFDSQPGGLNETLGMEDTIMMARVMERLKGSR